MTTVEEYKEQLEAEGSVLKAARWLASQSLWTAARHLEGKGAPWPTLDQALRQFNVTAPGDGNDVLRLAEQMRAAELGSLPPLSGLRDPIKESARMLRGGPGALTASICRGRTWRV